MDYRSVMLPKCRELSPEQLALLEHNFSTCEDLLKAPDLLEGLRDRYSTLDSSLVNLQGKLRKRAALYIAHSVRTEAAVRNINVDLQNLSLYTCKYGTHSESVGKMLDHELPLLVSKMQQVGKIREYAETALLLEALIGDLEDAVLFVANCHSGDISTDVRAKHRRVLSAVRAMNKIEDMLLNVVKLSPKWLRLLKSVDARVDKNLAVLRPQVIADHRALLVSLGWPPRLLSKADNGKITSLQNPLALMQGDQKNRYYNSFLALCALQHLQSRREERCANALRKKDSENELWAINELVYPVAERMEYHFLQWMDQPEFVFALVYRVTEDFIVGVDDILQPLIDEARLGSCSAKEAWVSAMVRMLSTFLKDRFFPDLAKKYKDENLKLSVMSSWLHLIDQAVAYDKRMQKLVNLETGSLTSESTGLSRGISVLTIFSDRPEWLKLWAKIELKVAWKKVKGELKGDTAWTTNQVMEAEPNTSAGMENYLLSTREDYKAPLVVDSILKIAWEMIERCQTSPYASLRIRFIKLTSVRFLWHFFNVMLLQFKRTELCPSITDDNSLKKVCGLINAAKYLETKLREWSDDVKLLEMTNTEYDSAIYTEDGVGDCSYFFEEEIKSMVEMQTSWLMDIVSVLLRHFDYLSCEYFQNKEHFEQELVNSTSFGDSMAIESTVSDCLVEALDALRSQLLVFKVELNSKDFVDCWRSVAEGLDHFISHSIIANDIHFSDKGVNQFGTDMQALFSIFQLFCSRPLAFFPNIREMIMLLKMKKEDVAHLLVLSNDETRRKTLHSLGFSHMQHSHLDKLLRSRKFGNSSLGSRD